MNERREPTISSVSVEPAEDKKAKASGRNPNSRTASAPLKNGRPNAGGRGKPAKGGSSALTVFTFLIAFGSLAAAGILFVKMSETRQELGAASSMLDRAEARIAALEKKLELTGDESVQSMSALQAKIKTNASEIRKLWGVSYDKNRAGIATNKGALTANKKAIAELRKAYKAGDGEINQALDGLAADVSVLSELMNAQQGVLGSVDKVAQNQKKVVSEISEKLDSLEKSLTQKVTSNEEAIQSIDAFRLQVNRELIRLRGG